jgi:2-dehydro-3-deoxyphosphogluconate aldolase/(4S)-4-hydroxy-2-oxoglutarate aldolase
MARAIMTPAGIRDRLTVQRVVPVLRLASDEETERAVACLAEAGFRTFEITLTTPGAVALIARLAAREDWLVGAGTVLDLDAARACVAAGAKFLVSPCLVTGMARLAHEAGRAALIGGFTPGEVLAAHREGADVVKVFPASSGGPEHLRAIHAVFPDIKLCPTGGVSLQNMAAYFAAGAALVGVGNNIVDQRALAAGDRASVVAHARRFLEPGAGASAA